MAEHLATGWEPDAPVDDNVTRHYLFTWADHMAAVAEAVGGRAERNDAAQFADAGYASPFDNIAILLRPPAEVDLDAVLADADAFLPGERPWLLVSAWPMPAPQGDGWHLIGHPPFMVRPAGGTAPPVPPSLRIAEVHDDAGVADYAAVVRDGFPVDPGALADPRSRVENFRMFTGYEEDRPVAVAAAYLGDGMADVCWVACMPDARGRGYGEALTWAATLADPTMPAGLCASDLGRPVYERMGYLPVSRFTLWMRGRRPAD
jgi:hypothetical protein